MPRVRFCLPSFSSFLRCCAVVLAIGACAGLQAQTAYLGQPLGGGFSTPESVAVDSSGNVYVADFDTNAVKEIPAGCSTANFNNSLCTITTLGGGFSNPTGVAVDGNGNVYVADESSPVAVKKIPAGCTAAAYAISPCVTTLGGGFGSPSGVAVDSSGNVYVADLTKHAVYEIPAGCTAAVYAITPCVTTLRSGFTLARHVALDGSRNIYVADEGADTVVEILAASGYSTANTLGGGFTTPVDVAVDSSGNVYVADFGDDEVKEVPSGCTTSSCVTTLGGGFSSPNGVAVDVSGNLYVSNKLGSVVNEIVLQGVNFGSAAIATSTPVTKTLTFIFTATTGLVSDSVLTQGATGLDFADAKTGTCYTNQEIHVYNSGDTCTVDVTFKPRVAGTRYGAVTLNSLGTGILATAYIYGTGTGPQVVFDPPTQSTIPATGLVDPIGVAVDGSGNVYIANTNSGSSGTGNVLKETLSGGSYTQSTIPATGLVQPFGVAVDGSGNVYIANAQGGSSGTGNVLKETLSGGSYTQSTIPATGLSSPNGVAVDGSGNVYIANTNGGSSGTGNVLKETLSGGSYTQSTIPATGLSSPNGVAVDGSGNVYIANTNGGSSGTGNVLKETLSGGSYTQSTIPATGLAQPFGVAVDGSGNVYIANTNGGSSGTGNVLKETLSGGSYTQSTIPATGLAHPFGVAVDGSGNVYIVNTDANTVLELDRADAPTVAFATTTIDGNTDSTDGAKAVTLENIGNLPLSISIPTSGNNPAIGPDFSLNSTSGTACPLISSTASSAGMLAAGASCNLVVSFAPTTPIGGALSESLVVTDTNLNANPSTTQSITLSGTAQATADYFTVTGPNPFPWYTPTTITITAHNTDGTVDTGYSGTFSIASSDPGFGNTTCGSALTNGTESCTVVLRTTGTQTITVSDTASGFLSGTFTTVESPGPASGFIVAAPSTTTSGNVISVTVTAHDIFNNLASGYTGTVSFNSTDPAAVLPASYTFTTGDAGVHTFSVTLKTPGSQTVTANDATNSLTGTSGLVVVSAPGYVVTTAADDATGVAGNCPEGGGVASCTLRDALAASAATGAGSITFDATVFSIARTITIPAANAALTIPANTTITGATSGSGTTLTNLVTVSGGGAVRTGLSLFQVNFGGTNTAIDNLIVTGANNQGIQSQGGAIANNGALTVNNSTFSGNSAADEGGAILNNGTLTVSNSTFSGNSSPEGFGGAINNIGNTLTVSNSTFSGNSSRQGGAILNNGNTLTVSNSTFSGNSAESDQGGAISNQNPISTATVSNSILTADTGGECLNLVGPACATNGTNGNIVGVAASLAALGSYGGPTQTLLPLPGSPAICAGSATTDTKDQRGYNRPNGSCYDVGAVQTNYSIAFVQQPSSAVQFAAMTPAPTVQLEESGNPFTAVSVNIPLTLSFGVGNLAGGTVSTGATGLATYPALSIDTPGTGDQLMAAVVLNPAITPTLSLSILAASRSFNITPAVSQLAFAAPPASTLTAGGNASTVTVQEETSGGTLVTGAADTITLNVTGPNGYSKTYQATASGGIAAFNLSFATLTATGAYSYQATSGGLTQAVASETVNAASASSISVVSGSGQNAVIGTAFGTVLTVKVVDAYSNPVSAVTATFTAPTSGASATLSASTCSTAADGTCSITATANGLASTTAYTVSGKVNGVSASSSFTLTNTQQAITLTVTPTAIALTYGQAVTINASIHPSSVLTSVPTGNITFYDGTATAMTPNAVVSGAAASDTVTAPLSGTHTYYATYNGDPDFAASVQTAATASVVVGKASATLTGPATQPVLVTSQQSTTIPVTIAGQYSGTGITPPSGQISYSILNSSNTSVANGTLTIASGSVTVPVGNTLAVGSYTVSVSYQGDTNYSASTAPTTITLQVGQIQPTISWAQPAAISYGTTLAGVLNASAMNGSNTVAGTYSYAVGATSVTAIAVLPASATAYTLTVNFTPTDTATYKTATGSVSLTVNQTAVGGITLTSSVNPILVENTTTLTATITSAVSIPTGSVSFYDGTSSTPLGTVSLVNGVAALPVNTLAVGTHSITAIYSGDSNFLTATSAAVSEQVEDFNINLAAGGNIVIPPGGTASYNFTISPAGSSTLPAGVALSVSGLPPGATYTFTPSTIATGSGATNVLLKISVPQEVGSLQHSKGFGNGLAPIAFGLLLLPFSRRLRKSAGKMGRITIALLLLMAGAAGIAGLTGCGSGNGFLNQPQQSYTLTITGTSGALTHSATAVLTVE